jgi:DnaJ-class molecular chaperone
MIQVTCKRCKGTGVVPHLTARLNARCFACDGLGHTFRKPAGKRRTAEDHITEINARLAELFPN